MVFVQAVATENTYYLLNNYDASVKALVQTKIMPQYSTGICILTDSRILPRCQSANDVWIPSKFSQYESANVFAI